MRCSWCAAPAQTRLTAADYEKFMGYSANPLVYHAEVRSAWLADEKFWYRVTTAQGGEFVLVDPAKRTRSPEFDHARLAAAATTTRCTCRSRLSSSRRTRWR